MQILNESSTVQECFKSIYADSHHNLTPRSTSPSLPLLSLFCSTWPLSALTFFSLASWFSAISFSRLSFSCSAACCCCRWSCCFRNFKRCSCRNRHKPIQQLLFFNYIMEIMVMQWSQERKAVYVTGCTKTQTFDCGTNLWVMITVNTNNSR